MPRPIQAAVSATPMAETIGVSARIPVQLILSSHSFVLIVASFHRLNGHTSALSSTDPFSGTTDAVYPKRMRFIPTGCCLSRPNAVYSDRMQDPGRSGKSLYSHAVSLEYSGQSDINFSDNMSANPYEIQLRDPQFTPQEPMAPCQRNNLYPA